MLKCYVYQTIMKLRVLTRYPGKMEGISSNTFAFRIRIPLAE